MSWPANPAIGSLIVAQLPVILVVQIGLRLLAQNFNWRQIPVSMPPAQSSLELAAVARFCKGVFGVLVDCFVFATQVCRSGQVQIMDKLIYYGADMNCQNGNGNTPLHISAINNQVTRLKLLHCHATP